MPAPFTYLDLKAEVSSSIWPNDAPVAGLGGCYGPENLQVAIARYFNQAVNWLQQNIECLRDEHLDVTRQCNTVFHCGLTVIDKPDGVIHRLFTIQHSGFCDPVHYDEVSKDEILKWSRWFMRIVTSPGNAGLTQLPGGFTQAASSTDDTNGRALFGKWAKDRNRILIAPWLQSYEDVVVEWDGYKTNWQDTDLVLDAADYKRAVKLFVQKEYAVDFERDPGFSQLCNDNLHGNRDRNIIGAVPALIHQCREKRRQRKAQHSSTESDYLWRTYEIPVAEETPVEETTVIAAIGDYGLAGTPLADVAALVKSWVPSHIITSGNNNYTAGAAATIDANVGQYFFQYITPYTGIYGAELGANRFWPSLGNRDLDSATPGEPYEDYFSLPMGFGSERYYDKIIGNVHLFFINSGYDTAGTLLEPDGNTETSVQGAKILLAAVRSTIRWKIAVFNSPALSSQTGKGKSNLGWNFPKYGFHAVINAGDTKSYERITTLGIPNIVNGIGGAGLVAFSGTPATGSELQYAANYGAVKITATCDDLTIAGINIDDEEFDTVTIT